MPLILNNNPNPQAVMLGAMPLGGQHLCKIMLGGDVVWQKHRPAGNEQDLTLESLSHQGVKLTAANENGKLYFPMFFQSHRRTDYQEYKNRLTFIGNAELALQTIDAMLEADVTDMDMQFPMFFFDRRQIVPHDFNFLRRLTFISNLPYKLALETIDGLLTADVQNNRDLFFPMVFPAVKPAKRTGYLGKLTFLAQKGSGTYIDFIKDFSVNFYDRTKDFIKDFPVNVIDPAKDFIKDFTVPCELDYDPEKDFVKRFSVNFYDRTKDFIKDFPVNAIDPAKDFIKDFEVTCELDYDPAKDFIKRFSINFYDGTKDFIKDFSVNVIDPAKDFIKDFTVGVGGCLRGITYGNGLFVAVGGDCVMTSPDGMTWTRAANVPAGHWMDVAYGEAQDCEAMFVAVGYYKTGNPAVFDSRIMTSPDGMTWTDFAFNYPAFALDNIFFSSTDPLIPNAISSATSSSINLPKSFYSEWNGFHQWGELPPDNRPYLTLHRAAVFGSEQEPFFVQGRNLFHADEYGSPVEQINPDGSRYEIEPAFLRPLFINGKLLYPNPWTNPMPMPYVSDRGYYEYGGNLAKIASNGFTKYDNIQERMFPQNRGNILVAIDHIGRIWTACPRAGFFGGTDLDNATMGQFYCYEDPMILTGSKWTNIVY